MKGTHQDDVPFGGVSSARWTQVLGLMARSFIIPQVGEKELRDNELVLTAQWMNVRRVDSDGKVGYPTGPDLQS